MAPITTRVRRTCGSTRRPVPLISYCYANICQHKSLQKLALSYVNREAWELGGYAGIGANKMRMRNEILELCWVNVKKSTNKSLIKMQFILSKMTAEIVHAILGKGLNTGNNAQEMNYELLIPFIFVIIFIFIKTSSSTLSTTTTFIT